MPSGVGRRSFIAGSTAAAAFGLVGAASSSVSAATAFVYPTDSRQVSDNFAAHIARNSPNPGTDYVLPAGRATRAVAAGTVVMTDHSTSGSGGRLIYIDHDDGAKSDYLHLSRIDVGVGQRVASGQQLGLTGASADGSENGVGAHLHISLHLGAGAAHGTRGGSVDFEKYVGSGVSAAPAPREDEEMGRLVRHPNGSVAFAATDGTFTILNTMDEVEALKATGAVTGDMIQLSDPFIWNLRVGIAQKRKGQNLV